MALVYTRELTDEEVKILENDLLDIKDWIDKAIQGKINNCSKRLAQSHRQELIKSGAETVPAKDSDLIKSALSSPLHKKRSEREANG